MKMQLIDVKELKPAKYNPREITPEAFNGLKASIKEFGIVEPFIVNTTTGNLVGGHQRLKAVKELKIPKVPVVHIAINKHKEKILNVTLNNPMISGHYTKDLRSILEDLKIELPDFDFDAMKLVDLEHLIPSDLWESDFKKIDAVPDSIDSLIEKLIIECPRGQKEAVKAFIAKKLEESEFKDVSVR